MTPERIAFVLTALVTVPLVGAGGVSLTGKPAILDGAFSSFFSPTEPVMSRLSPLKLNISCAQGLSRAAACGVFLGRAASATTIFG